MISSPGGDMDKTPPVSILTIDDDHRVRETIVDYLEDGGYKVFQASNGLAGLAVFRAEKPDLVLVDLRMPEMDGHQVLTILAKEAPETPLVVVSGTGVVQDAIEAVRLGAWDYMTKPIEDMAVLDHTIATCLERARLRHENRLHRERLEEQVQERTKDLENINRSLEREIEARKESERRIAESLKEKELLLKEIHHRVKNNLQVISSLLSLQTGFVQDEKAREAFTECRHRVRSMALIHERLYKSEDMAGVDMQGYAQTLVTYLVQAYNQKQDIRTSVDMGGITMGIDRAIPLGLIINELVSNAVRHAFAGRTGGEITLSLGRQNDHCLLTVRDDGRGMPDSLPFPPTESLGLLLVDTLSRQLTGRLTLVRSPGVECTLVFPAQG